MRGPHISDADMRKNYDELAADNAADAVRGLSNIDEAIPQIVVSEVDADNSVDDESTDSPTHKSQDEEDSLTSLQASSRKRKFREAWEKDTDIDAIISEGTGEALPVATQEEHGNSSTSKVQTAFSKSFAEQIEAEELRRTKKQQRNKRTLKAIAGISAAPVIATSGSNLGGPPSLVTVHGHSLNAEQNQPPVPRDWSSSEMLGIVCPEPNNISQTRGSEKRPGLILPRRELVPPFLPQRLLPTARLAKLPPPRINIPMSDWNQDTSPIRNPLKKGLRILKIPSRLYTSSGTMESQLRVASWKNEIYAARDRGERHPEDFDREYWGAQILADEKLEEDEEEEEDEDLEAKVMIREVPAIVVSELAESTTPAKRRKRVADPSKLQPPKASPTKKPAPKTRAQSVRNRSR